MLSRGHWFLLAAASAEAILTLLQILSLSFVNWRLHPPHDLWQYNSFLWLIATIICTYPPPRNPIPDDTTEPPPAPDWHNDRLRTIGLIALLGLTARAAAELLSWLTHAGVSDLNADQVFVLSRCLRLAGDIGTIALIDFHRRRAKSLQATTARRCSMLALSFYTAGTIFAQIHLIRSLDWLVAKLAIIPVHLTIYLLATAGLTLLAIAAALTARRLSRLASTIEGQP